MSLGECRKKTTHREYLAWIRWLDDQWDRPTRSDWYAMQTACEVRRVLKKDPNKIQPKNLLMKFVNQKPKRLTSKDREQHIANIAALAKGRWAAMIPATALIPQGQSNG